MPLLKSLQGNIHKLFVHDIFMSRVISWHPTNSTFF